MADHFARPEVRAGALLPVLLSFGWNRTSEGLVKTIQLRTLSDSKAVVPHASVSPLLFIGAICPIARLLALLVKGEVETDSRHGRAGRQERCAKTVP